ncbi:PREDICTED: uncharacterized protein LOC104610921 [Nelumbo nucifera]|uniref:Uncharacterized protein LOC104610921 n=2 Tax=Nelumbo nucifera TaxID=4432 RepID=A0A1U8B5C8_NELNU|nr:PREDICTED: uncharacterized protein LOC104610921 [Nelumbo nucifera]DAD20496.1 TPA_asm: hypothetical protein HUJ06_021959 [Nelumbo nucifera]
MAKGRKLGSSHHERLLGTLSYGAGQQNGTDASELGEEDVWSMVDDMVDRDDHTRNVAPSEWASMAPESNGDRGIRSRRWVAREDRHVGGLSLAFNDAGKTTPSSRIVHQFRPQDNVAAPRGHHMAASAPVNVPDWPKILRVDSVESLQDSDDGIEDHDAEWIPPHEYLAREYARTRKMTATSVFEGVGRTLKGRDMSRVRDAVWSQTGFDG